MLSTKQFQQAPRKPFLASVSLDLSRTHTHPHTQIKGATNNFWPCPPSLMNKLIEFRERKYPFQGEWMAPWLFPGTWPCHKNSLAHWIFALEMDSSRVEGYCSVPVQRRQPRWRRRRRTSCSGKELLWDADVCQYGNFVLGRAKSPLIKVGYYRGTPRTRHSPKEKKRHIYWILLKAHKTRLAQLTDCLMESSGSTRVASVEKMLFASNHTTHGFPVGRDLRWRAPVPDSHQGHTQCARV